MDQFEFKRDEKNGMLIGPDDCHYETESEAMYFGTLGLCGCGRPEYVHHLIIECMKAMRDDADTIVDYEKVCAIVKGNPDIVAEFILHFLDSKGLTEHGGSVYGSWLTGLGYQFVKAGVDHTE